MSCKNTITTCIKCYRKINSSFNLCRYGTKSPLFISLQWGNYGDSSNTLITLNLNITSSKILFAIATDITNNGNPQGAYLGYDVIENNKIRFLFDATPWTFAWFCISK